MAKIIHPPETDHDWDHSKSHEWRWQEMVAQLCDESMQLVVQGPDNRSRGLVACKLVQSKRYDHKTHHAMRYDQQVKGATEIKLIWDFILSRNDGTCVALHPEWKKTEIWSKAGSPVEDLEIPATGLGGRHKAGTFQYFIGKQKNLSLIHI